MSPDPPTGGPTGAGGELPGTEDDVVRWRLDVAYDGSGFRGFAAQRGQVTVAGSLGDALGRFTRCEISLTCAGRTDAGVHATGQVVHVDLPAPVSARIDPAALRRACNRQLAPAIAVLDAVPAPPGFDARRSATARRYRYLVHNAAVADPLLAGVAWHVSDPLDLRAMSAAADAVRGEHDFRAFCRRAPNTSPEDPIRRRVVDARWTAARAQDGEGGGTGLLPATGSLIAFDIEGSAFCHQMVRSLVGTLADVGRGRKRVSDLVWILESADRQHASQPAPPHGLCLVAVRYAA